jgi:hypothetical protein
MFRRVDAGIDQLGPHRSHELERRAQEGLRTGATGRCACRAAEAAGEAVQLDAEGVRGLRAVAVDDGDGSVGPGCGSWWVRTDLVRVLDGKERLLRDGVLT